MKKKLLVGLAGVLSIALLAGCGSSGGSKADSAPAAVNGSHSNSYTAGSSADAGIYDYVDYDEGFFMDDMAMEEAAEGNYAQNPVTKDPVDVTDPAANRKLITTVDLSVETYDFDVLLANVESRTAALGGYVERMDVDNRYDGSRVANYTIRVPEPRLDEFTDAIADQSNITNKTRNVEDVTLSYVDMQSRKEVLRSEEKRLLEMLDNAQDIETMITVESRLSEVQQNIESMESQLRVFDNRINFSTIYLNIREVKEYTEPVIEDESAWERMSKGFKNSLEDLGEGLADFGIGFVIALPYLVFAGLVIFGIVMIIRGIVKSVSKKNAKRRAQQYAYYQQQAAYQQANGRMPVQGNPNAQGNGNMQAQNGASVQGNVNAQGSAVQNGVTMQSGVAMPGNANAQNSAAMQGKADIKTETMQNGGNAQNGAAGVQGGGNAQAGRSAQGTSDIPDAAGAQADAGVQSAVVSQTPAAAPSGRAAEPDSGKVQDAKNSADEKGGADTEKKSGKKDEKKK